MMQNKSVEAQEKEPWRPKLRKLSCILRVEHIADRKIKREKKSLFLYLSEFHDSLHASSDQRCGASFTTSGPRFIYIAHLRMRLLPPPPAAETAISCIRELSYLVPYSLTQSGFGVTRVYDFSAITLPPFTKTTLRLHRLFAHATTPSWVT